MHYVSKTLHEFYCLSSLVFFFAANEESGEVEIVRYGYVDKTSGFQFTYEDMESDQTVFPGKQMSVSTNATYAVFYVCHVVRVVCMLSV